MKKTALTLGLCAAALIPSAASAAEIGPYVGLGAGLHMAVGSAFESQTLSALPYATGTANYELGYGLAAAIGYRWSESVRLELELSHRAAGLDDIVTSDRGSEEASGRQSSVSAMVNVLFDVGVGQNFYPYIGGGIGMANNSWSNVSTPSSPPFFNDSDKRLQWQAILGLELPVGERMHWFVDYRFVGSESNVFNSNPVGSRVAGVDFGSHNLMIGVRYTFGN
jgi:opacity protein-like surface antigen